MSLLFNLASVNTSYAQGPSGGKGSFSVQNPTVNNGRLVFNYYAPYPGLTKVKLYDSDGNLLWRGQYIDPEGNNELRLRSERLEPGEAYVFQFDYKLESVRIPFQY